MKPLAVAAIAAILGLAACGDTAKTAAAPTEPAPAAAASATAIAVPSAWTATEIAGKPVVTGSTVTLEFAADGKVSGVATCNRFFGPVTLEGAAIKFGALASTRMACVGDDLNQQETAYLAALAAVDHAAVTGDTLELTGPGTASVRFRKLVP